MSFSTLGLRAELLRAVAEQGYTEPTPIQVQAIPPILAGRDIMAAAQTGTGKTAGFALPLLQRLSTDAGRAARGRAPRALILVPTRELAAQVADSVSSCARHLPLRSAVVFGGVNINPQIKALRDGIDILVATPGRLLDHVGQRTVSLASIEILVLDEADRMLDMGFVRDIRKILALLPKQRQNLLFSATFSDPIKELAGQLLSGPTLIEVARRNATADGVVQHAHEVHQTHKRELLAHLIKTQDWQQVLVFTRTKHGANRLSEQLAKDGIAAAAIHGNKSQPQRTRALAEFKQGLTRVLVATDIAARGLDIEQLPHVVNYELPNVPEDYVHRIGRTGRAGCSGVAVSLVSHEEKSLLAGIRRLVKQDIPVIEVPGFQASAPSTDSSGRDGAGRSDSRLRHGSARSGSRDSRPGTGRGPRAAGDAQTAGLSRAPTSKRTPGHTAAALPQRARPDAASATRRPMGNRTRADVPVLERNARTRP